MLRLIIYGSYFILLFTEILLSRLLRSKNTDQPNADKNSLAVLWVAIITTITIAVFISRTVYCPIFSTARGLYAGAAILLTGIAIRLWAVYTLGQFFTVDVTIRQNHQLKKDGLYAYLRHPSYSASLLSFVGMGLTLNNWISLVLLVGAIFTVYLYRINIEEKVLIRHFGSEYLDFQKATKRLVPFVY